MSRSGLFRAAALLAAGAAPLLAGSASAAPAAPQLDDVKPDATGELITNATQAANPLEAGKAIKLPAVKAPVNAAGVKAPEAPAVPGAQERTLPNPIASELGTLPGLPNPNQVLGGTHVGDVQAPSVPNVTDVESLKGQLPSVPAVG